MKYRVELTLAGDAAQVANVLRTLANGVGNLARKDNKLPTGPQSLTDSTGERVGTITVHEVAP